MRPRASATLLLAALPLAGCLAPAAVEPAGVEDAAALLARPWLEN